MSGALAGAKITCSEEDSIVLDKWLLAACDEDGLQFPAHRRPQYGAYVTHARHVAAQKVFVGGTFVYPKRDGPAELNALRRLAEGLEQRKAVVALQLAEARAAMGADAPSASAVPPAGYAALPDTVGAEAETREERLARRFLEKAAAEAAARRETLAHKEAQREEHHAAYTAAQRRCDELLRAHEAAEAEGVATAAQVREATEQLQTLRAQLEAVTDSCSGASDGINAAGVDGEGSEDVRLARLRKARAAYVSAAAEATAAKEALQRQDRAHTTRLQQARQALQDWQAIVSARRQTAEQRAGQVRVLRATVRQTTQRLAEEQRDYKSGEADASYTDSLRKFNALLMERTAERWYGTTAADDDDTAAATAAPSTRARPLAMAEAPSSAGTTPRRVSLSPAAQRTHDAVGHRSRYEVVRHLQRWADALSRDHSAMQAVLQTTGASDRAAAIEKLKEMLVDPAA